MADKHEIDVKVNAEMQQTKQQFQQLIDLQKQLQREIQKTQELADKNNQHVSSKRTTNIRNMQNDISQQASNIYNKTQNVSDASAGSSQTMQKLAQDFARTVKSQLRDMGYNSKTGGVRASQEYNDLMRPGNGSLKENPSRNFLDNPGNPYDRNQENLRQENNKFATQLKNLSSDIHNNQGSSRRMGDRIGTSLRGRTISYERNKEYEAGFGEQRKRNDTYSERLNTQKRVLNDRIRERNQESSAIDSRISRGTNTREDNIRKNQLQKQLKQDQKFQDKLEELSSTIEKTTQTINDSENQLHGGTGNAPGQTKILRDRDTFGGQLQRHTNALGMAGATGLASVMSSSTSAGINNRLQSEQYVDPIMYTRAQNGSGGRKDDRRIFNDLSNLGIKKNGTGYGGKDMTQFAGAYTSSTGSSNYEGGANAWSRFSRFSGAGQQNTLALETSLGESGVRGNQMQLSKAIQDNIAGSGQQGRVADQVQGLTSYANYAQQSGAGLSNQGAQDYSAMQGILAENGGSRMQGQMGAQAIQQASQGLSDTSNPMIRATLAQENGSNRYAGVHGQYNLQKDASKMKSDPGELGKMIKTRVKARGGDTELTALDIQQATGMDIRQAKSLADQASKGKLDTKSLKQYTDKNKGESDANEEAYDSSTNSTNNEYNAQQERNQTTLSEMTDINRQGSNGMFRNSAIGGAVGSLVGGVGASLGVKMLGYGLKPGARKAGSLLRGTKLGKAGSNLAGKAGGLGSRVKGFFGGGSEAGEAGAGATKTATEAGETATKGSRMTLGKSLRHGGRNMQRAGKGFFRRGTNAVKSSLESTVDNGVKNSIGKTAGGTAKAGKGFFRRGTNAVKSSLESTVDNGVKNSIGKAAGNTAKTTSKLGKGVKFLGKAGKGLGKVAAPLAIASSALDIGSAVATTKKGSKKRHKKIGGSIGSTIGGTIGATLGSFVSPVLGTAAGGIAGAEAGDKVGNWVGGLFKGKKDKKGKKGDKPEKQKTHKKSKSVLDRAKSLLKGFNDMLDKALRVIAQAKDIKGGGDDSDGGSGDDVDDVSGPKGSGVKRWKGTIKKVAKAMGQKITDKDVQNILSLIEHESQGNEKITQGYIPGDPNNAPQNRARGLLQFVPSTFDNYKVKGHENIFSGVDSLYALFNDSSWRSDINPSGGWNPHGSRVKHARGGIYNTATARGDNDIVGEAGTEAAVPLNAQHAQDGRNMLDRISPALGRVSLDKDQVKSLSNNSNFSPNVTVNVNVPAGADGNDIASSVQQGVTQSLQETMSKMTNYFGNAVI